MSNTVSEADAYADSYTEQPKKSRGCLYGCLAAIAFMGLVIVCGGIGGYYFFSGQVEKYTDTEPLELDVVEYSEEELAELQARLDSFEAAVDEGSSEVQELELTADDINALISEEDKLKGRVFVTIEEGQIGADVSMPADFVPGGKGRYFNGSVKVDASMEDGILIVTLVDAEVAGEPLPAPVIESLANENLAKEFYKNEQNAKTMRRFEEIRIEDDRVFLRLKPGSGPSENDAADSTDESNDGETIDVGSVE